MEVNGIEINYLGHSGFMLKFGCEGNVRRVAIDPYNVSEGIEKADVILITHSHYDHCSIKDIQKISRAGSVLIVPADVQSKITRVDGVRMEVMEEGEEIAFGNLRVEAVPAYNIGKKFHTKKDGWIGYVVKLGKVIVYHAGDTDLIPEMDKLTGYGKQGNYFICLLPVSGVYVMTAEEAVSVVEKLKPLVALPMHYGSGVAGTIEDAKNFVRGCREKGLNAMILEKS